MNKNNEKINNLLHMLTTESRASLHKMDISHVSFDERYYRKRYHQIRLYKHCLLTNALETYLCVFIKCLLALFLFCLTLALPIVPMITATIIIIRCEEQRCRDAETNFMSS